MLLPFVLRLVTAVYTGPLPEGLPAHVALRHSRWIPSLAGRLSGMGGPAAAVTLGRTILVHPDIIVTPELLRHELAHVRQWKRFPLTFPFRYLGAHLRHGYWANPFEREARADED